MSWGRPGAPGRARNTLPRAEGQRDRGERLIPQGDTGFSECGPHTPSMGGVAQGAVGAAALRLPTLSPWSRRVNLSAVPGDPHGQREPPPPRAHCRFEHLSRPRKALRTGLRARGGTGGESGQEGPSGPRDRKGSGGQGVVTEGGRRPHSATRGCWRVGRPTCTPRNQVRGREGVAVNGDGA